MTLESPVFIPFLVPIGVVIVMLFIQLLLLVVAGIGFDFDFDADTDADVDVDVDVDAEVEQFSIGRMLSPLTLGYVPLSIVLYAYGLSFGVTGIALTFALSNYLPLGFLSLAATIPTSFIVGWFVTKRSVRIVAPLFKTSGLAEDAFYLIGRKGVITSSKADGDFGEIAIKLNESINHMVVKTSGEVLARNTEVVVTAIDDSNRPIVAKCN